LTWVLPEDLSIASIVQIKVGLTVALLSVSIIREVLDSVLEEVFFRPVAFGHLCCDTHADENETVKRGQP
jgi:hypothetical protein